MGVTESAFVLLYCCSVVDVSLQYVIAHQSSKRYIRLQYRGMSDIAWSNLS